MIVCTNCPDKNNACTKWKLHIEHEDFFETKTDNETPAAHDIVKIVCSSCGCAPTSEQASQILAMYKSTHKPTFG